MTRDLINDNAIDESGGGLGIFDSNPILVNNTVNWNTATLGGGIFRRFSNNLIVVNSINWGNSPNKVAFPQNYLNPFNSTTSIRSILPEPSDIAIEIYNIPSQRVAVMYGGFRPAGSYSLDWNVSDRSSGVYFARIRGWELAENIMMVLLR